MCVCVCVCVCVRVCVCVSAYVLMFVRKPKAKSALGKPVSRADESE